MYAERNGIPIIGTNIKIIFNLITQIFHKISAKVGFCD